VTFQSRQDAITAKLLLIYVLGVLGVMAAVFLCVLGVMAAVFLCVLVWLYKTR
jgi:hypothetical protein